MYLTNTGRLVIGMAQFVQTHNGGKARSVIERSMHILEMQEAQEAMPSKSDYIFTFIEQEKTPSTYAIITSGGVPAHLFMYSYKD